MPPLIVPAALHEFRAVLYADVRLVDPGHGSHVDLTLRGGLTLRVRVSPELLRLGRALRGRYRAGLAIRTTLHGQLKPPLRLIELTRHAPPIAHASRTCWSATGLVADAGTRLLVFRTRQGSPVRLSFQPARGVQLDPTTGQTLYVQGVLRGDRLIATAVSYSYALEMPRYWQPYTPPLRVRR